MIKLNTLLLLIALSVLAAVHLIALEFYLYWYYLWLDIPVHFLGGVIVSLGLFAATEMRLLFAAFWSDKFWRASIVVWLVMIAWEVFEVWAGIPILDNYVFDTTLDLAVGWLGGTVGFLLARRINEFNKI
jgi:hypothetical protein